MKKNLLFTVAVLCTATSFGQKQMHGLIAVPVPMASFAAKTTGTGDTVTLSNISATATARVLYAPAAPASGYTTGTNSYNDRAFAERYAISGGDSSVKVIGVLAQFGGTVNPASTKTITLKIWSQSAPVLISGHLYNSGFPSGYLDSMVVPVNELGISSSTLKSFLFPTPTNFLSDPFFAGYSISYNYGALAGDTIGLTSSENGSRTSAPYSLKYNISGADTTSVDTFITVQNATQWSDYKWYDNYTQNDSSYNNLAIFPIVIVGTPSSVHGITKNELTLFGAYPNPANSDVTIRFALGTTTGATISVADMTGRVVLTQNTGTLTSGTHSVNIDTHLLPPGDYIYLIRTTAGDGMAGKLAVCR